MHSNISDSFGSAITSVKGYLLSIILTTAFSWPIGLLIKMTSQSNASILLPFIVFVMSFIIMSCPQVTSPNLMILVMYIVVASNVREDISRFEPLGWAATYIIGLSIAIIVNIFPFMRSSAYLLHKKMSRLEKDFTILLMQCKIYADHTATAPIISRVTSATIDMISARIIKNVKAIKKSLSSAKVELRWQCKSRAINDLDEWVHQLEKLLAPVRSLQNALTQHVLGEDLGLSSPLLLRVKKIIKEDVISSRNRMIDAMIAAIVVCDAWADPESHKRVLPDVEDELRAAMEECALNLNRSILRSAKLLSDDAHSNVPIFAHMIRRTTAFDALFEFAESLLEYLKHHRWEQLCFVGDSQDVGKLSCPMDSCSFFNFIQKRWLWRDPEKRRIALKTSVGMAISSLFVSIDYLWSIAEPFGVWPGLTIASVSLGNTGSSFHKAQDRLFGTLLAAAYALLVSDLFPGNRDTVKIPAITLFTFFIIYMRNSEHAYKFTYAATSIGSMLYGSVKNNFNIEGYIPKRIELIFVGVVVFSFVELLLFPRSSHEMVEHLGFELFFSFRDFMRQASICVQHIELYVENFESSVLEQDGKLQFQKLEELQKKLKAKCSKIKTELESGINEPHIGLSLKLNAHAFRALTKAFGDCETQTYLLLKSLTNLAKWIQDDNHPIRSINWAPEFAGFLGETLAKLDYSCDWLKSAFPDTRIRPQKGNSVRAVIAAATFRGLDDIRLKTISQCSVMYRQYVHNEGLHSNDPAAVLTIGITLTYILDICRHLQKAGKNLEQITYQFPTSTKELLSKEKLHLSPQ